MVSIRQMRDPRVKQMRCMREISGALTKHDARMQEDRFGLLFVLPQNHKIPSIFDFVNDLKTKMTDAGIETVDFRPAKNTIRVTGGKKHLMPLMRAFEGLALPPKIVSLLHKSNASLSSMQQNALVFACPPSASSIAMKLNEEITSVAGAESLKRIGGAETRNGVFLLHFKQKDVLSRVLAAYARAYNQDLKELVSKYKKASSKS